MSKSKVPVSWATRLMFNKASPNPINHHPIPTSSSPFLFRHNPNHTRPFFGPMTEMLGKYHAKSNGFVDTRKYEERQAAVDYTSLVKSGLLPMYRNAYETGFPNRMIHNLVERAKQSDDKPVGKFESYSSAAGSSEQKTSANVLRPLSPHLPVYQPQVNATLSILNRISACFLTAMVTSFYLIYLKLGPVCLSFESFYQFLFYSSKLTLISVELTVLALVYHAYAGYRHLFMDFSGSLLGKVGKKH